MDWFTFYKENENMGTINEIVQAYNMYVFQNQSPQVMEDAMRRLGTSRMILQENSYVLIQEGVNQYGLLQELGNDKNLR
jgi:hypothetical protein